MATVQPLPEGDPITAALPPATDYITYLTILEYQLGPDNLKTLNGFLNTNDGTLAKEIGWDLLRLVLPKLRDAPADAKACLEIIARKGNPREVVVRVAEELEKLGRDEEDVQADDDDTNDESLRTFQGEANRIHLGDMKLDGMPDSNILKPAAEIKSQDLKAESLDHDNESAVFAALLSMLSLLHPRIKTQYPSRFLATSLPAALAAYRRMPITIASTSALLACLSQLAGKQKPALPHRDSANTTGQAPASVASLPDPEAPAEAAEGTNVASQSEADIIRRLLQAVMLEMLDEYTASLSAGEVPAFVWTGRLREQADPTRSVPGKQTLAARFANKGLADRDDLSGLFVKLGKTLQLDVPAALSQQIQHIKAADENEPSASVGDPDDEVSEYPTSPSDIPFPTNGLILLAAAQAFRNKDSEPLSNQHDVVELFKLVIPLSEMPSVPNAGVQDALHSILYGVLGYFAPNAGLLDHIESSDYQELMSILTQTFVIQPDATARDDAHFLATKMLHVRKSQHDRVSVIKQALQCMVQQGSVTVPLATPFTEGALRAVGANWLKDEILVSLQSSSESDQDYGIPPTHLQTDRLLNELVWHPNIPSPTDTHLITDVLMALPYYIALLNLANVLVVRAPAEPSVRDNAKSLQQNLEPWRAHLNDLLATEENVKNASADVYALEDAVTRLGEALAKSDNA
jgi:hypothetical protein